MLVVIHVTTSDGIVVQKVQIAESWDDAYDKATKLALDELADGADAPSIRKSIEMNLGFVGDDWNVVLAETE